MYINSCVITCHSLAMKDPCFSLEQNKKNTCCVYCGKLLDGCFVSRMLFTHA